MERTIVWQYGSTDPDNGNYLDTIRQWWATLSNGDISWQQRLIPPSGEVGELDWEPQRFDEVFILKTPEIRGITLYWRKPDTQQERNITARKLELDRHHSCLYVYPKSQPQVVIRVGLRQVTYQKVELTHPTVTYLSNSDGSILVFQDDLQKLEVKVTLTQDAIAYLKQQLSPT